jgi:hypothetical protein
MMALDYVVGAAFEKVLLFRVADLFAGFEGSGSGFLFGFGPVDGVNIHLSLIGIWEIFLARSPHRLATHCVIDRS